MSKKVLNSPRPGGRAQEILWDFSLRVDSGSAAARARAEPGIKGRKGPGKLWPGRGFAPAGSQPLSGP